jgi:L-ascorbate metabolism protein UlaG (beta-lactamase superfamily)
MTISWYGQSCFRLETKGVSLLIDPFSKDIGLKAPRLNDNIFLVSHEHFDHNNVEGVPEGSFVINGPGEYEKSGVRVQGIVSYHDNKEGTERGLNTIYVIDMEEMRLCHLGDLGQAKLTEQQIEAIGDIDILFIPIGGRYTINASEAEDIIKEIDPKIIIPMHYKVPGLEMELDGPQKFLKEMGLQPEEVETYRIAKKLLPQEETKLVIFKL